MIQEMQQAYGDWIKGLRKWVFFGHFTFSDCRSPQSAKKAVSNFIKWLDPKANFILGVEPNKLRKGFHIHILVDGLVNIRCLEVVSLWHKKKYGNARLYPYDNNKPGAYYLSKYPQSVDFSNM